MVVARAKLGRALKPDLEATHARTKATARVYIGDCTELIPRIPECAEGKVDLVFADPPFNWNRDYDREIAREHLKHRDQHDAWHDAMEREDYVDFTHRWLDACIAALAPHGALWVNIPDDTAAEIVIHLKQRGLHMINWCVWHYRFGQNTNTRFINSKVHALYFAKAREPRPVAAPEARRRGISGTGAGTCRIWNPDGVLELSDRRAIYGDPRTEEKNDGMPAGMRLPMDVWYGKFWGRIQGNNKERRPGHDNQLPEVYLRRVIRACSDEGMVVMDPFLGSGTTGVVAFDENRHFIGCEYSTANARSAWERITKIGPLPRGQEEGEQSTAIFAPRKVGGKRGRKPKGAKGTAGTRGSDEG